MKPRIVTATKSQIECELHEHHPLRLVAAQGRRIQCISGVAWITAFDQPVDVFLRPGRTFTVPNDGVVLAEAVGTCRIRVDLPRSFDYSDYRSWMPAALAWIMRSTRFGTKPSA